MKIMDTKPHFSELITKWMKSSVSLKLFTIGFIILILLIPSSMIQSIIYEREGLRREAIYEVSNTWSNAQVVAGPILTIPVETVRVIDNKTYTQRHQIHILPTDYNVNGTLNSKTLSRGIYQIVVYESELKFDGNFNIKKYIAKGMYDNVFWDEAFLTIGVSDLRGIQQMIQVDWNGSTKEVEAGSLISSIVNSGVTVPLKGEGLGSKNDYSFSFNLNLQGSENFSIIPLGSETSVDLQSSWSDPSFSGKFLPDTRTVSDEGFEANWTILELNRDFPQSWRDESQYNLSESAFGVKLLLPMDDYQKTTRSAKYAIMTIGLTFLIFFLVELINKQRIHPFQYTLVGLALCLFYILLVSISEHLTFNNAYLVASVIVISMIVLYSRSVFTRSKLVLALCVTLIGIYGFVFVTLQLTDSALLLGSIGLAIIIAATMYLTRNIQWYRTEELE
jgi:inner membrane protein